MNCAGYSESDFVVINDRGTRYVLDIQPSVYHCVDNTLAYYDDESGGIKHVKCKGSKPVYENKVYPCEKPLGLYLSSAHYFLMYEDCIRVYHYYKFKLVLTINVPYSKKFYIYENDNDDEEDEIACVFTEGKNFVIESDMHVEIEETNGYAISSRYYIAGNRLYDYYSEKYIEIKEMGDGLYSAKKSKKTTLYLYKTDDRYMLVSDDDEFAKKYLSGEAFVVINSIDAVVCSEMLTEQPSVSTKSARNI